MKHKASIFITKLLAWPLIICSAHAQDASQPTSSTETYESWNLACSAMPTPNKPSPQDAAKKDKDLAGKASTVDPAKKDATANETTSTTKRVCEVSQIFNNSKTGNEVARFSFFYDPQKKDQLLGGLRTFVDTSFEKPVSIMDGEKELMKGGFRRCVGPYCYAVFDNVTDQLPAMTAAAGLALQFPIGSGQLLRVAMSSKGLAASLTALKSRQ